MRRKQALTYLFLASIALNLSACAAYKPGVFRATDFADSVQVAEDSEAKVTAIALGAKESQKVFGVPLASQHILPIWLQIENKTSDTTYRFPLRSLSAQYYTANEAAYIAKIKPGVRLLKRWPPVLRGIGVLLAPIDYFFVSPVNRAMGEHFEKVEMQSKPIGPHETNSGFTFIPFQMGTVPLRIDLFTSDKLKEIDLDVNVPGIKADYEKRDFETFYKEKDLIHLETDSELYQYLKDLPCCLTNRSRTKEGDPLNLVIIGELDDVLGAFAAAYWAETEIIDLKSMWKMVTSFTFDKEYEYAPVSSLYFEGRDQDVAIQKSRSSLNERMHLRLWLTPARYQSKPVWVGGVSRDIGVRFTKHAWNLMTHQIDSNIDEAREYTVADLFYANRLVRFDFATGSKRSDWNKPAKNLTGDPFYSDGERLVIQISKLRQKEWPKSFDWENVKEAGTKTTL